jgi:hypothetical protein
MSNQVKDHIMELLGKPRLNKIEAVYLRNVYNSHNNPQYEGCMCTQTERNLFVPLFSKWFLNYLASKL